MVAKKSLSDVIFQKRPETAHLLRNIRAVVPLESKDGKYTPVYNFARGSFPEPMCTPRFGKWEQNCFWIDENGTGGVQ